MNSAQLRCPAKMHIVGKLMELPARLCMQSFRVPAMWEPWAATIHGDMVHVRPEKGGTT